MVSFSLPCSITSRLYHFFSSLYVSQNILFSLNALQDTAAGRPSFVFLGLIKMTVCGQLDNQTLLVGCFQPIEMRTSSDEDLKLTDTLAYYTCESSAAKDLLYRRSRALADYHSANKALDRARARQRDIAIADEQQTVAHKRFNEISEKARLG